MVIAPSEGLFHGSWQVAFKTLFGKKPFYRLSEPPANSQGISVLKEVASQHLPLDCSNKATVPSSLLPS